MGLGEKIGRSFLKMAEKGKEIDEGLDDLLGQDRTKPGDGFSKQRTAKRTSDIVKKDNSDKLSLGKNKGRSSKKDNSKTPNFMGEKSDKEKKDEDNRRFY
jgi:hypothetical protein